MNNMKILSVDLARVRDKDCGWYKPPHHWVEVEHIARNQNGKILAKWTMLEKVYETRSAKVV